MNEMQLITCNLYAKEKEENNRKEIKPSLIIVLLYFSVVRCVGVGFGFHPITRLVEEGITNQPQRPPAFRGGSEGWRNTIKDEARKNENLITQTRRWKRLPTNKIQHRKLNYTKQI